MGINAVLNLQTHDEMRVMGIDWISQMNIYKEFGI